MSNIKVDLSKVKVSIFLACMEKSNSPKPLFAVLGEATDGKIFDCPWTDLPAILAQFERELAKSKEDIDLAIFSMRRFLRDNDD